MKNVGERMQEEDVRCERMQEEYVRCKLMMQVNDDSLGLGP